MNVVAADGINRQVLLLYGSLPAPVINFVLTEKFGQDPHLAASIVVLSTFLSVFTVPLVADNVSLISEKLRSNESNEERLDSTSFSM